MSNKPSLDELFDQRQVYPDIDSRTRLDRLIGLDEQKSRLAKILGLLVHPAGLEAWANEHHPGAAVLLDTVLRRPPLVILAGAVGSGQTELAETIGDAVARQEQVDITPVSYTHLDVYKRQALLRAALSRDPKVRCSLKHNSKYCCGVILGVLSVLNRIYSPATAILTNAWQDAMGTP